MSLTYDLKKKSSPPRRWGRWVMYGVTALPWLWLLCFGTFLAFAVREIGYMPTPYNPDPKDLTTGGFFYLMTWLLFFPVYMSPVIGLFLLMPTVQTGASRRLRWTLFSVYVVGLIYAFIVIRSDLGVWFMD